MVLGAATLIDQFAAAFNAVGATWVLWLLIVLSILSVAIMIERVAYFASHSLGSVDSLAEMLASGDLAGAVRTIGRRQGLEAEIVREGVRAAHRGPEAVEERLQGVTAAQRLKYERFLSLLGTLGNNAPFIGLFGTVIGILGAFAEIARSSKGFAGDSSGLMAQISEALVATAVGLLVALPAVAVYNSFMRWLKTIIARGEVLGHALVSHLKSLPETDAPTHSGPAAISSK